MQEILNYKIYNEREINKSIKMMIKNKTKIKKFPQYFKEMPKAYLAL